MFSFTSIGTKIHSSINDGCGPPQFILSGQNYHRIGSLLSNKDQVQILHNYIFMTQKMKQQTNLVTLGISTYFIFVLPIIAYIIDPFVILQF